MSKEKMLVFQCYQTHYDFEQLVAERVYAWLISKNKQ